MPNQMFYVPKHYLIILAFLFASTSLLHANSNPLYFNSSEIKDCASGDKLSYPVEKIYIHFDRSSYFFGRRCMV